METNIYRINPTGYYGDDSLIASALDSIIAKVMEHSNRLVTIWANNASGNYSLFYTLDNQLIDFDGIPITVGEAMQNPQQFADQILEGVEANKNNVAP